MRTAPDHPAPTPPRRRLAGLAGLLMCAAVILLLSASSITAASGHGWTSPRKVASGASLTALHELAASGGRLHVVHADLGRGVGHDQLLYQRSVNGGATWSARRVLWSSGATYRALIPNLAVAARDALVAVAFRLRGSSGSVLSARVSRDGGVTFGRRLAIAVSGAKRGLGVPAVTISHAAILVAWTDRRSGQVRSRRSTDGGRSFGSRRSLGSTELSIDCGDPTLRDGLVGLTATGSRVHLAWADAAAGDCLASRVRIRDSANDGSSWSKPRVVTGTDTYGWPELAARGRRLIVALLRPNGSIVVDRSKDGGRTFAERVLEPQKHHGLGAPDVSMGDGGRAWLVYPDLAFRGNDVSWSRLLLRPSADYGKRWGRVVTVSPRDDRLRQIANLGVWQDRPVVVYQSGPIDGSRSDIWSVRRS